MGSDLIKLFKEINKLNLPLLWFVFIIVMVLMCLILFFFSIYFIVGYITKPLVWLYKKIWN